MNRDDLQARTKQFAIRVVRLVEALPNTVAGREIGRQLPPSAMSVAANYRAARRARSRKEFAAKIGVVSEEADDAASWVEMIIEGGVLPRERVADLAGEADALMKVFAASRRTAGRSAKESADRTRSPNHQVAGSLDQG